METDLGARLSKVKQQLTYTAGRNTLAKLFESYYFHVKEIKQKPIILVLGPGRSGKDTIANFISRNSNMQFNGSSSVYLCKFLYGDMFDIYYRRRHEHKEILFDLGNAIRDYKLGLIPNVTHYYNDIISGLRDKREVHYVISELKPTTVFYPQRDVPDDTTMAFTLDDVRSYCNDTGVHLNEIDNTKGLYELYQQLLTYINYNFELLGPST